MARNAREEEKDKDRKKSEHHHDKDHKPHKKPGKKPGGSTTEDIKAMSTQSGQDALNATPGQRPAEPANAEAVYTTGPGQAVEYNYTRQGTYSEDYARQQSEIMVQGNPVAGPGQVVTSGAANNPT